MWELGITSPTPEKQMYHAVDVLHRNLSTEIQAFSQLKK